ncbi:MAG: tRNA 2-thiocytidine biosynthesis protein TtcA [Clostridia bacterium]|nr:tRNA 2-thiocytidine biosynthesis protein TtcA [Clostridia bacterium]
MLMSRMRAAMQKYHMIAPGDVVGVGVSGGKDSLAVLVALDELRRFYPEPFSLIALTVDPGFGGVEGDYSAVAQLCEERGIPYVIRRSELARVIFEDRREKNPCSLCAAMRRGMLHDAAKEAGCTKLALGHHLDDAVVTFYMNLLNGGHIGCFSPVSYLSRKDLTVIRPMIFAYEREVEKAARKLNLPVVASRCPVDGVTERQRVKDLLDRLQKESGYASLYQKTITALQNADVSGWGVEV